MKKVKNCAFYLHIGNILDIPEETDPNVYIDENWEEILEQIFLFATKEDIQFEEYDSFWLNEESCAL